MIDIITNLKLNPSSILEIGTGTGAISIALAKEFSNAKFISTDINKDSLTLAKQNAIKNDVLKQIYFICCNWLIFCKF